MAQPIACIHMQSLVLIYELICSIDVALAVIYSSYGYWLLVKHSSLCYIYIYLIFASAKYRYNGTVRGALTISLCITYGAVSPTSPMVLLPHPYDLIDCSS